MPPRRSTTSAPARSATSFRGRHVAPSSGSSAAHRRPWTQDRRSQMQGGSRCSPTASSSSANDSRRLARWTATPRRAGNDGEPPRRRGCGSVTPTIRGVVMSHTPGPRRRSAGYRAGIGAAALAGSLAALPSPVAAAPSDTPEASHCVLRVVDQGADGELRTAPPVCFGTLAEALEFAGGVPRAATTRVVERAGGGARRARRALGRLRIAPAPRSRSPAPRAPVAG